MYFADPNIISAAHDAQTLRLCESVSHIHLCKVSLRSDSCGHELVEYDYLDARELVTGDFENQ